MKENFVVSCDREEALLCQAKQSVCEAEVLESLQGKPLPSDTDAGKKL